MTEYNILGVKVNTIAEHLLKSKLSEFLYSDGQHQITTVNPEFIVAAQKNQKFLEIINHSSLALIDGAGIIKALQYLGYDVSLDQRITGVRLNELLLDLANHKNFKVMFCLYSGGLTNEKVLSKALKKTYPNLNFQTANEDNALEVAKNFLPEIILVGFGAPWQNFWINENLIKIPSAKIAVGVGGALDFLAGTVRRAPKIMRSLGLEWLWRLSVRPNRLLRIIKAIIIFPYLIYKNKEKQQSYVKNKN